MLDQLHLHGNDLDKSNAQYTYALHLLAYTGGKQPATGSLDPQIVNRFSGLS